MRLALVTSGYLPEPGGIAIALHHRLKVLDRMGVKCAVWAPDYHGPPYDYDPACDPPDWHKFITIKQNEEEIISSTLPLDFAGSLPDRYVEHNPEYRGFLKDR